jgi:hypothetical protein
MTPCADLPIARNITTMLGKSAKLPIVCLFAVMACAHNVPQDDKTGEDGKIKGAKEIRLENGEGKAKGIVTYPGGDRVDWKMLELDKDKRGQLDVELKWSPPRPGLKLNFDVFDEWNQQLISGKRSGKRSRTASLTGAKGKYFIRVYAVGRGDAGAYKLTVDFKEQTGPMTIDVTKLEIPDPPKLAAIPEEEKGCNESMGDTFDPKNPRCINVCPQATPPPPNWAACAGKCPNPPDPANQACWSKVCPNPPTIRAPACKPRDFPPCNPAAPDPENFNCNKKAEPVTGRVISTSVQGSDTVITIAVGSDQGVTREWKGHVLRGDSTNPYDGGDVTIINVGKRQTVGKVKLTIDIISQNPKVKLGPP